MIILGIVGSPRKRGNTTILLEQLLGGAAAAGAETQVVRPAKMNVGPCIACEGCYKSGRCVVKDDFQGVYDQIIGSDAIVVATPVYFGAMSGQVKPLIDRGQCFWAMRDVLHAPMPPAPAGGNKRKGVLICTSGIKRDEMFECARRTFLFWIRSLQGQPWAEMCYSGLDVQGEITENKVAMERATELGRRLALGLEAH